MYKKKRGDMFKRLGRPNEVVVVTASQTVKKNGCLIMDGKIPSKIARLCGDKVAELTTNRVGYGFLRVTRRFGIFQVKYSHMTEAADYLVSSSASALGFYAIRHPRTLFHLNCPFGFPQKALRTILDYHFANNDNIWVWRLPDA